MQPLTAYGAFIVEDAAEPIYKYDDDLVVLLGDIYHASDANISAGLLNQTFDWLGEPQAITINGDALGNCTSQNCTSTCHHHVFEVEPDRTYRVRTIGASALTFPYYAIEDHHSFTVIAADAQYLSPVNTSHIQADSGQRFDHLLRTKSARELASLGKTTFWGRVETRWRPAKDPGSFILSYRHSGNATSSLASLAQTPAPSTLNETVFLPTEADPWINNKIQPLPGASVESDYFPASSSVTRNITLNAAQLTWNGSRISWFVDGAIVRLPSLPSPKKSLTQALMTVQRKHAERAFLGSSVPKARRLQAKLHPCRDERRL